MRHIWTTLSVVPARGHYKAMKALGGPFSNYYAQTDVDAEGFDIQTEVAVKEVSQVFFFFFFLFFISRWSSIYKPI